MNKRLWNELNSLDEKISDLGTINKLVDSAFFAIETGGEDEVMNALLGVKEYIKCLQAAMDANYQSVWKELRALSPTKFYTQISDDGVLTIPDEIMAYQNWDENTQLDVTVGEDRESLIITEVEAEGK